EGSGGGGLRRGLRCSLALAPHGHVSAIRQEIDRHSERVTASSCRRGRCGGEGWKAAERSVGGNRGRRIASERSRRGRRRKGSSPIGKTREWACAVVGRGAPKAEAERREPAKASVAHASPARLDCGGARARANVGSSGGKP